MLYIKAIHIIFVVTWFAALFYMPRLLIYNTEAGEKNEVAKKILREQFTIMMSRLWFGIATPSATLTLIFGIIISISTGYYKLLAHPLHDESLWFVLKLIFVVALYAYHFFIQKIFLQEQKGIFNYTSKKLRMLNELATVFLLAIVMLVVIKTGIGLVWGLAGLLVFIVLLMSAIKLYALQRKKTLHKE